MDKRKRKDKDGESSKSKKKHKKHKKNKKSKKHDVDGKERIKKHKKHHKRSKSSDGYNSESNVESTATKARCDTVSTLSRPNLETKPPPQTTSTLNTKFTEIMKSNGHVVVAKAPLTKFNNGNGAESSKRDSGVSKVPTDPSKLVEFITKSLDPNTSTQVVSSATSESDTVADVDSPDVAVIEDDEEDLNLEELMRQKALLQARLGGIPMSDTESENSHKTPVSSLHRILVVDNSKINDKEKEKEKEKEKLNKRRAEPVNDVILLDDSSNDASAEKQPSPPKKKVRSSRSKSRERLQKDRNSGINRSLRDNRDTRENEKLAKGRRSDVVENRFKEDLRREIDRDKERAQRQSTSVKPGTHSPSSKSKPPAPEKTKMQSSFREREVNDDRK